jgi:two-component system OmpR family sensor kinase
MRPLDRLAETASKVAELRLDRGEVALSVRVDEVDTDPRTEVGKVGDALNRMLGHVSNALNARQASESRVRRFVADASHELRTPLTMLKMELELMRQERPEGDEFDVALEAAIGDTDRLSTLSEDLLVLARADRDRLPVSRQAVDVRELLDGVAARYPDEKVSVGALAGLDGESITIQADPARLEQALGNLVDNALGHGAAPVTLSAVRRQSAVELHVTDAGEGFPPDFLPRAFDRFSQASVGDGGSGTGLGLAIVRAIAEAHGGTAAAANRDGGADIWLELPT